MDALAAEAFLNADHRVCGLRLRPLSIGHAFTLEAIGSPFYHGQKGDLDQLQLAAWICSRPPLAPIHARGFRFALWQRTASRFDLETEAARWSVYVGDYCSPPQMWNKAPKAGEERREHSRIPSQIITVTRLMRLGISEKQAWETPVGIAAWYEAASFEAETGEHLDIVTDSERVAIIRQKLKQHRK
jgi:hypothetical protein